MCLCEPQFNLLPIVFVLPTARIFMFHTHLKLSEILSCGRYPKLVSLLENQQIQHLVLVACLFKFAHFRKYAKWFSLDDSAHADEKKTISLKKKKHTLLEAVARHLDGMAWFRSKQCKNIGFIVRLVNPFLLFIRRLLWQHPQAMPEVSEKRSSCSFIFGKSHLHLL